MTTVQDILERKGNKVHVVDPNDNVLEAARLMNAERIGALIICTEDQGVVGIFTERDVLRRVIAEGRDVASTLVKDVMSSPVACCRTSTTLQECQNVMTAKRLRHLPVVDDGKLVGMISIGDLMAQEMHVQQTTIEYLHEYLHGRM